MPKSLFLSLLVADRHPRRFIEFLASGTPSEAITDLAPRLGPVEMNRCPKPYHEAWRALVQDLL
jgi:hypothetical protein